MAILTLRPNLNHQHTLLHQKLERIAISWRSPRLRTPRCPTSGVLSANPKHPLTTALPQPRFNLTTFRVSTRNPSARAGVHLACRGVALPAGKRTRKGICRRYYALTFSGVGGNVGDSFAGGTGLFLSCMLAILNQTLGDGKWCTGIVVGGGG